MLTPLDISDKEFGRALRGYSPEEVDGFLDRVIQDYQRLYKENMQFKEQLQELGDRLDQYQNLEDTLNKTLVTAQETADYVKKNADKEAEMVYREAKLEADKLIDQAREEVKMIQEEKRQLERQAKEFTAQLRAQLLSHLYLLDGQVQEQSNGQDD